jgi:hypothetical protein
MGRAVKAVLATAITCLLILYVVASAYVEESYSGKIEALRRDIDMYDSRGEQLYRQQLKLEATVSILQAALSTEQANAKALADQEMLKALNGGLTRSHPGVGLNLTLGQTTTTTNTGPTTTTLRQINRLQQILRQSTATTTRTVTRAS